MTVNSQRLTILQQNLEALLTEKRTLNSKVVSDSYNQFKNYVSKIKAGRDYDLRSALKKLEQSLKNEGAYKNVKSKFEIIKADILEIVDSERMKASRRDNEQSHSPQRLTVKPQDKSNNRARTVTLQHAQERQKVAAARNHQRLPVQPAIKRPVIQTDTYSKDQKTPKIDANSKGSSGRASPEALVGLHKTISRLFDQLEIERPKYRDPPKAAAKPVKSQVKTGQSLKPPDEVRDVKQLMVKLQQFEDEFQKKKMTQEEQLQSLMIETDRLQAALTKKEQELDRIRSTQSIAQKAKGKAVERMAEIREHEKRDMVVKLQTLELNIKKNLELNQKEVEGTRHRQVLDNLSTEILRVCKIVNQRNKIQRTRSLASNLTTGKDADTYDDLLPRIVSLGEEIQLLQKTKSELSRDNNDLQIWKTSFAEVTTEIDLLWKEVYSNMNYPDVRHMAKGIENTIDSPRSKSGPLKAKIATARALLTHNSKKLETLEKARKAPAPESNSSGHAVEVLKKVTEELNKIQTDYSSRLSNSRLSLRSVSTSKSDEPIDTSEISSAIRNVRKIIQDFESRNIEYEKTIKDHDKDLDILRHRIVKLGAGVLNDDNVHDIDNDMDNKQNRISSEKLDTMLKKLEIFDERLRQLQEENKIFKRQLEGKNSNSHRLAVLETDVHELCYILKVHDAEKYKDNHDKMNIQLRMCKSISKRLMDDKENIERKLANAIIDETQIIKHVETLHHHVRKIRQISTDLTKPTTDSNVVQTAIEEAQAKLNEITVNIDQLSMEKDDYKKNHDEKTKELMEMKDKMSKLQIQVKVRESEIKDKTTEVQRLRDAGGEISKENKQLQENIESLSREKRQIEKEMENLKSNLDKCNKDLAEANEEKATLLRRLSKAMGNNIIDGNPAVANLSDPYRPEKLAEKFSQLYDDEWTTCYEILTTTFSMDEKMAAECLLNVAKEGYRFCYKLADKNLQDVSRALLMVTIDGKNADGIQSLTTDEIRQIKNIRKALSKYSAAVVIGLYKSSDGKTYITEEQLEQCEQFVSKCIEICWLMTLNDPPVHMHCDVRSGEQIDTNNFRYFTNSGNYVEYLVWPTLLLNKNGPVIAKGVIQVI